MNNITLVYYLIIAVCFVMLLRFNDTKCSCPCGYVALVYFIMIILTSLLVNRKYDAKYGIMVIVGIPLLLSLFPKQIIYIILATIILFFGSVIANLV